MGTINNICNINISKKFELSSKIHHIVTPSYFFTKIGEKKIFQPMLRPLFSFYHKKKKNEHDLLVKIPVKY